MDLFTSETSDTDASGMDPVGRRPNTLGEIRETYADQAEWMGRLDWLNQLTTGRYRRRLFGKAEGRVLDVACGIATNRRYLPETTEYVGIDLSPEMLRTAAKRQTHLQSGDTLREMDAQELDFADDSFDTVISSLSTCTFPDPVEALQEMNRVCKPDGQVLLLEHGRSSVGPIARFQDWRADAHYEKHSCRWNQNPVEIVSKTDLEIETLSEHLLGIITLIEGRPG